MRLVRLVLALMFVGLVSGAAVAATFLLKWGRELPDYRQLDNLRLKATSRVFSRDNQLIGVLVPAVGEELVNRRPVTLSEISPAALAAIVASEDRDFFKHYGFDAVGIARSVFQTLLRDNQQGASTITQQLIRSTILENKFTVERKIKEIMLAIQVERYFSKEEVLSGYLNAVFWGGNVVGIRTAAQSYLGKDPLELTLAEGVYLASLLPAPNDFFRSYKRARGGMRVRLDRLVEDGWVSQAEANAAWLEKLQPRGWQVSYDGKGGITAAKLVNSRVNLSQELSTELAPHFMFEVRKILAKRFPGRAFDLGGLKIYTTLDPKAQRAAEAAVERAVRGTNGVGLPDRTAQMAVVGLEPKTGEVLALVGGRAVNGEVGEFNRATQSTRQPGSSIKPLLYATAIESGLDQWQTFEDKPLRIPDRGSPGGFWEPQNFAGALSNRDVTMRYALDHSLNLPTIRIGQQVGMPAFRDKLRLLGFPVAQELNLASTIGSGSASPLQMATAYASFVNGGLWVEPQFIREIRNADDEVLYRARPQSRRVWTKQTAYVALDMIRGVVNDPKPYSGGFAYTARIPNRPVGGKTGTTNDVRDLWFVGVTPQMSAAVWIGRDDNKPMPERAYSGTYNPPVWRDFVSAALEGRPPGEYIAPEGVYYRRESNIEMAYRTAMPTPTPVVEVRPPPEPPRRVSVDGPPPPREARVVITLNVCASPIERANETTPPECAEERSVRASDLDLYEPASP